MNEDFLYVVKKSLIIDEWKKRRFSLAKKDKVRQRLMSKGGFDLKSILAASFKKKL